MVILRALLFPFSIVYDLLTRFRNHLYDIGHKKSFRFDSIVIGVGNLNVGGSGKTPMIEYLSKYLLPRHRIAILSRGYDRNTTGLRFASEADSAVTIGDEPFQFYRKFGRDATVAVCEDRAFAIPHILQHDPLTEVILMDDAFQHRAVDPQLSILLTDYALPFYRDYILPAGRLREARIGAKRSHLIVVTKCPAETTAEDLNKIKNSIQHYTPGVPVFFTGLAYELPVPFGLESRLSSEIVLVTGIANSKPIADYLRSRFTVLRHFSFRDHHRYTLANLKMIHEFCEGFRRPISIITTEKDMVKLINPTFKEAIGSAAWHYLPVRIVFLKNGSDFDSLILHAVETIKQSI